MFQAVYINDPSAPYATREKQLIAKYGIDYNGVPHVQVELNGVPLIGTEVGFMDFEDEEVNLAEAKEYAAAFNRVWVMVEQTVEVLGAIR